MKDEFITRVGVWGQRHYQRKQVIADFIKQNYPPEAMDRSQTNGQKNKHSVVEYR